MVQMDTFTLMVAIILMMMFLQYGQNWLVLGTMIVVILSTRSPTTTIALIIAGILIYFTQDAAKGYWPLIIFGLVILALILGLKPKPAQPDYYAPDLGGMMGGGY